MVLPPQMSGTSSPLEFADSASSQAADATRFRRASLIGSILAVFGFLALISRGFTTFSRSQFGSNFYDVQAQAMLHGRFSVSAQVASIEGISVGHRTYLYFGPFLSLLHMPVVGFFPATSGHLTQCSMSLGFAVLLAGTAWLSWIGRQLVHGATPLSRKALVAQAAFMVVVGLGTVAFYLAGCPTVYFETELWGAALAMWCLVAFLRFFQVRSLRWLIILGCMVLCVSQTRTSVAIGMIVLLGLAGLLAVRDLVVEHRRPRATEAPPRAGLNCVLVAAAELLVIVAAMCWVNDAKFRTFFSIPFSRQRAVMMNYPPSLGFFFRHHNSILGLRYLPTTVAWYLSPFALHFGSLFPFFDFTQSITVLGKVRFAWLQPSSSMTDTMPLLLGVALFGVIALLVPRRFSASAPQRRLAFGFRCAVLAAFISALGTLAFTGIANRYMADFLPLLVVSGVIGLHAGSKVMARRHKSLQIVIAVLVTVLGLWSIAANGGLGLMEAFVLKTNVQESSGAGFLNFQISATKFLTNDRHISFLQGSHLPSTANYGEVFVQNSCSVLYTYQGAGWGAVEVGQSGGHYRLSVSMPQNPTRGLEPLLVAGTNPWNYEWWGIQFISAHSFVLRWTSPSYALVGLPPIESAPQTFTPGQPVVLDLTILPTGPAESTVAAASVNGTQTLRTTYFFVPVLRARDLVWTIGHFPSPVMGIQSSFSGALTELPVPTPLCHQFTTQH